MGLHIQGFRFEGWRVTHHGLKRTGKSCRLRWVNYLDPALKRGKMTPHEERLVIQLHSKWGNRWSRIAEKLPGRTDNEIKNFWRTYMRHKAQEKKGLTSFLPSSSSLSSSESHNTSAENNSSPSTSKDSLPTNSNPNSNPGSDTEVISFYDTGGIKTIEPQEYPMDDIWRDIDESGNYNCDLFYSRLDSPISNYYSDSLWAMGADETDNFPILTDQIFGGYDQVSWLN